MQTVDITSSTRSTGSHKRAEMSDQNGISKEALEHGHNPSHAPESVSASNDLVSSRLQMAHELIAERDYQEQPYDPESIQAYYHRRPFQVISRVFQIFWPAFTFALGVWIDQKRGWSKQTEIKRAVQLREMLTRLGPAYIKVGQALSTRPDLVSTEFLNELTLLQDQIPPFPNAMAYGFIQEELGAHPNDIFAELSESPIAAASLGQVYKGKLKTGEVVAVKVQRPGLAQRISLDIYILRMLAAIATRLIKNVKSDLVGIMDEFGERIYEEMDYVKEGLNAEKFAELYGHIPDIYVPQIYWEFTHRRVLTMEWITGTKLTKPEQIRSQGIDAGYLVEVGVQCSLRQLLEHGFFHADPHPGNLLATPEGKLAYLDFGMMSQVKVPQRYGLLEAVVHLVNRDFEGLARDYVKLEFLSPDTDLTPIIPAFSSVFTDALGASVAEMNFKSITDQLSELMYEYPFRVPAYYALIIRSLVTLEGIAIKVDPEFKVLSKAYPYVAKRLLSDPAPELRASLKDLLFKEGQFRWNRLANLLRNARNSPDYDLNAVLGQTIDFLFSERGAFVREQLAREIVSAIDGLGQTAVHQVFAAFNRSSKPSPKANQAEPTSEPSNLQYIMQILTILRDTPGFEPKTLLDLIPQLFSKPEFHQMNRTIASQLVQRAIARFIREFFLTDEVAHTITKSPRTLPAAQGRRR
jgi:predicted unusual protein kinase regulating ubiquinone biosynthesis (AarF/ABC1/UbiB family)